MKVCGINNNNNNINRNNNNNTTNNNNNNSATYFPKFDFGQVDMGMRSCWWGANNATERKNLDNNRAEAGAEFGNRKMEQLDNVKVKRAVLSEWTPLDDSV